MPVEVDNMPSEVGSMPLVVASLDDSGDEAHNVCAHVYVDCMQE